MALPEEMAALHKATTQGVVIVTPSGGRQPQPRSTRKRAQGRARVAWCNTTSTTEADKVDNPSLGKGIRLNLSTAGINDPNVARQRFLAAAGA